VPSSIKLQLIKVKIVLISVITFNFSQLLAQAPFGVWSYGISGSVENFFRTLKDPNRFSIDPDFNFGLTDAEYIAQRNLADKPYFPGKTVGLMLDYKIGPRLNFESGLNFIQGGSKVEVSKFTNFPLVQEFGIENYSETVVSKFSILEVPLVMRHRIGIANKLDLSRRKTGSSLTNMYRHFFLAYGIGLGVPVNGTNFYNGIEYRDISGNMGISALAGIGFHMNTRSPFFINIRANARATLLGYYEYAPVKSFYHSVGAQVKLGYRLAYEVEEETNNKPTDCASFINAPNVSSRPKLVFGMKYGAQSNFVMGSSASDPLIGFKGIVPASESQIETAVGEMQPIFTPNIGLHFEYLFHTHFSIGLSPSYSQRGFKSYHTYFLNDGRTIKTRQRAYVDYIDIPVRLLFYESPKFFVHSGPILSIRASERLYDYYQVYDGLTNFPNNNLNYSDKITLKRYFGDPTDGFTAGWEIGGGIHVDEDFSVSAQLSFFEGIFQRGNGRPQIWNTTLSISAYYFFIKK